MSCCCSNNMVSVEVAKRHFELWKVPRRVRDKHAENEYIKKKGKMKSIYRRVRPHESNRGNMYPIFGTGIKLLAHFGIGVGIYYIQLLLLAVLTLIVGFLMIPSMISYRNSSYDTSSYHTSGFLTLTAVCGNTMLVNVTLGCGNDASLCEISYRPQCDLPSRVIIIDMIMCIILIVAILSFKFIEKDVEETLDEAVQSSQDYSIVVKDPDPDAFDPDEWQQFFSRFGVVRYVTITKKNAELGDMLLARHKILNRINELSGSSSHDDTVSSKSSQSMLMKVYHMISHHKHDVMYWKEKLYSIDKELSIMYLKTYPACKVFITFELESQKRLALNELEVPDYEAIFDIKSSGNYYRSLFRGHNVLNIAEPPEPDNILWMNLEMKSSMKHVSRAIGKLCVLAFLVMSYFIVVRAKAISAAVLSIVVVGLDFMLCVIFKYITNYEYHPDEAKFQSSLQIKLFGVRLLLTTIFPYLSIPWYDFLNPDIISQIISVQISSCFASAIFNFFDIPGYMMKHIIGPSYVTNQAELNRIWSGKAWDIAERYTNISKIMFVSLFYTLLTPISLLISSMAFYLTFHVDRYLLLRKWEAPSMFNADVAKRLRQQMILCIAAHMMISCRLIYSWPMDDAYLDPITGIMSKVDKYPHPLFFYLQPSSSWHTSSQKMLLMPYQVVTAIVCLIVIYYWIVHPMIHSIQHFFFKQLHIVGDAVNIPFTSIKRAYAYVPIISSSTSSSSQDDAYIFADTSLMRPEHKPSIIPEHHDDHHNVITESEDVDHDHHISSSMMIPDLSMYVPEIYRRYVLSSVKYYDDDLEGANVTQPMQPPPPSSSTLILSSSNPVDSINLIDNHHHDRDDDADDVNVRMSMHHLTARETRVRDVIGDEAFIARMKIKAASSSIPIRSGPRSLLPPIRSSLSTSSSSSSSVVPIHHIASIQDIINHRSRSSSLDQSIELFTKQKLSQTINIISPHHHHHHPIKPHHTIASSQPGSRSSSRQSSRPQSRSSSRRGSSSLSRGSLGYSSSDDEHHHPHQHHHQIVKEYLPRHYQGSYRLDPIHDSNDDHHHHI